MSENNQIIDNNLDDNSQLNTESIESEWNRWGNLVEELEKSRKEINDIL